MAVKNRDLMTFVSSNVGAESLRLARSDESHEPIEAISDGESAYATMPFGRYTSAEVLQMWNETLKQFEEKLKPLYDSLMSDLEERSQCNVRHHKLTQEKLEQRHKIMQALIHDMCEKICTCIERRFAQIPVGQPAAVTSSFRPPRVSLYEVYVNVVVPFPIPAFI